MEAIVRYTEGTYTSYNFGSPQTWKDKGFDLKIKLLDESEYFPAVAVGALDFGGTGFYSSEYFVASKRIEDFDFTLGIGWGRFANSGSCWLRHMIQHFVLKKEVRLIILLVGFSIHIM